MYARSSDWPLVFWKAFSDDGVDPSSSLTHLINDNLLGRMQTGEFNEEILGATNPEAPKEEVRDLIGEMSFRSRKALVENEIRCGDMFQLPKQKFLLNLRPDCDDDAGESGEAQDEQKFLLNLRPDCDCVPRNGQELGEIELYCIEGKRIRDAELEKLYEEGRFREKVWEHIVFSVHERRSIRFDFRKLRIEKFCCLREKRIGRLLHPYLTRIQQRFGLYQQRQGLPRIPEDAVGVPKIRGVGEGES